MKLIKLLIALVIITLINYLFFSFIQFNWNPAEWGVEARLIMAILSLVFSFPAIEIIISKNDL